MIKLSFFVFYVKKKSLIIVTSSVIYFIIRTEVPQILQPFIHELLFIFEFSKNLNISRVKFTKIKLEINQLLLFLLIAFIY